MCTQKTGLSAVSVQRELGFGSYRTAWLMLQKLRQGMVRVGRESLSGHVGKLFHRLAEQLVLRQAQTYGEITEQLERSA